MWGPSLAASTHIVLISCLPLLLASSGEPTLGGGWSWTSSLEVSCCLSAALCVSNPCVAVGVGSAWCSGLWLLTRVLPTWGPFRQDLSSQGKCSWTNMAYEQSARQVGEMQGRQWGQFPPFVLHQ